VERGSTRNTLFALLAALAVVVALAFVLLRPEENASGRGRGRPSPASRGSTTASAIAAFRDAREKGIVKRQVAEKVAALLKKDMSREEVQAILGNPDRKAIKGKHWLYTLNYGSFLSVSFGEDGKMTEVVLK